MNILKISIIPLAILFLLINNSGFAANSESPATSCKPEILLYTADQVRVIGVDSKSPAVEELLATFSDLVQASNDHAIEDILKHYSPQFISGDNLTLDQIKSLIQETWQAYPDICYSSKPVEIRFNGDWATVETMDHSIATAPPDKDIMNIPGRLSSESRSMLFFKKIGKSWEITSDTTLWEQAIIRYGIGDDVEIMLSAPEQVKAGESYSVIVRANIPNGTFSIATIDNQPLIYPHEKVDDKFRTLEGESHELQRVLKANTRNRNEIVTATLGLTNLEQKDPERPSLSLNGIATIVRRVNVVPISVEDAVKDMKKREIVKTSADGKIQLFEQESSDSGASSTESKLPPLNVIPEDHNNQPAGKDEEQ